MRFTPHPPTSRAPNGPRYSPEPDFFTPPEQDSTSLDPLETNEHPPPEVDDDSHPYESDIAFRHAGWGNDRARIRRALSQVSASPNRLEAWDQCGSRAWVFRSTTDPARYKVRATYCHDRFCKPCARAKALTIAGNLQDHIQGRRTRFVTLTLAPRPEPLRDQITRLYQCFTRLRRQKWWKLAVKGGAAFFEVTVNPRSGHWHPHLHIIVEGKYIPQQQLSNAWKDITGDSYIVDVRAVSNEKEVAQYVCKYVGNPFPATLCRDSDRLEEAIEAINGRRTCLTFGSWRGIKLTKLPEDDDWQAVAPLGELREAAKRGDHAAQQILAACRPNTKITLEDAIRFAVEEDIPPDLEDQ